MWWWPSVSWVVYGWKGGRGLRWFGLGGGLVVGEEDYELRGIVGRWKPCLMLMLSVGKWKETKPRPWKGIRPFVPCYNVRQSITSFSFSTSLALSLYHFNSKIRSTDEVSQLG